MTNHEEALQLIKKHGIIMESSKFIICKDSKERDKFYMIDKEKGENNWEHVSNVEMTPSQFKQFITKMREAHKEDPNFKVFSNIK